MREILQAPYTQLESNPVGEGVAMFAGRAAAEQYARYLILVWPPSVPYRDRTAMSNEAEASKETLAAIIMNQALLNSRWLIPRFGVLVLVPVGESELQGYDATGVAAVQFEAGSTQEAAWQELVYDKINNVPDDFEWKLKQIFAGTTIQVDTTEFAKATRRQVRIPYIPIQQRSRRDTLGLILLSCGWSCEQRGEVLVLRPHQNLRKLPPTR